MNPKDSQMSIKEGAVVMSFDYNITQSTTNCLFHLQEGKLKQEALRLEKYRNSFVGRADRAFQKLSNLADKHVISPI